MARQSKIIADIFTLTVNSSGGTFKGSFEVDKNAEKIIGISISSDRDDIAHYRGSQVIKINDEEFIPEGFESKRLMCGQDVPPNLRMWKFENAIQPGNRKVDIIYTDSGKSDMSEFSPHDVYLYVFSIRIPEESE